MFICPNCGNRLFRAKSDAGFFYVCPRCGGRAAAITVVRRAAGDKIVDEIWSRAKERRAARGRRCPMCNRWMAEIGVPVDHADLRLDLCRACRFLWFDSKEFEQLPPAPAPPSETEADKRLFERAKGMLAIACNQPEEKQDRAASEPDDMPDVPWQWAVGVLGLPVEIHARPVRSQPWATWGLAAVLVLVFLVTLQNLAGAVKLLGFVPGAAFRYGGVTWLTSFFLHGGLWHLAVNVYFLLVFGDNVEDYLGRWRYLVLLVGATLCGGLAHMALDPRAEVPAVGASGGVSGVIAFYALRFPHARLAVLFGWLMWLRFPALAGLAVWVLLQLGGAMLQIAGMTDVSALAHLGGAAAGLVAWIIWRKR